MFRQHMKKHRPVMGFMSNRGTVAFALTTLLCGEVIIPQAAHAAELGISVVSVDLYFNKTETAALAEQVWQGLTVCGSAAKLGPWGAIVGAACAVNIATLGVAANYAKNRNKCVAYSRSPLGNYSIKYHTSTTTCY